MATNFRGAAENLGIEVLGVRRRPPTGELRGRVHEDRGTDPDAVFIGGLIDENSGQLINDKVAVLGENTDNPDDESCCSCPTASRPTPCSIRARRDGERRGAYFSVAGVPIDEFEGTGAEEFITGFEETLGGTPSSRIRSTARSRRRSSSTRSSRGRTDRASDPGGDLQLLR